MFENTEKNWSVDARATWIEAVAEEIEKRQTVPADYRVSVNVRDNAMSIDVVYFFAPGSYAPAMVTFTDAGAKTDGQPLRMNPAEAAVAIINAQFTEEARRDKMKDAADEAKAFEKETEDIPF